jgi:hypothetical protein
MHTAFLVLLSENHLASGIKDGAFGGSRTLTISKILAWWLVCLIFCRREKLIGLARFKLLRPIVMTLH